MKKATLRNGKLPSGLLACTLGLLAGAAILLSPGTLPAQDQNGTWLRTASGDWSNSANWDLGLIANGAGYTCFGQSLTPGVTRTITVDSPRTIGGFRMDCNGANRTYVFTGTNAITLSSGHNIVAVNGPLVMEATIAGTEGVFARPYGALGSVTLAGTNVYTGNTEISRSGGGGPVMINSSGAIPHGSGYGDVVFVDTGDEHGILDLLTNDITINGLSTQAGTGDGGQVTSSSADAGVTTLTVGDGDATATFDGSIKDGVLYGRQLALVKIGAGTQTLTTNNNYTGGTTINAGMLVVDGDLGSYLGTVTINGGVLGGSGTIYDAVVATAGGSISGGSSVGKLILSFGLDLSAGGTNIWELGALKDDSTGVAGSDFDQIDLQAGLLDVNDSTLSIRLGGVNTADPFWTSTHNWTVIITAPAGSGDSNFKTIEVLGGTPAGSFSTANTGSGIVLTFTPGAAPAPKPIITSISGAGTASVTVNYTNTVATTNYILQYNTNLNTANWYNAGTKAAPGTSDSQTDATAIPGEKQRYYRVRVQ